MSFSFGHHNIPVTTGNRYPQSATYNLSRLEQAIFGQYYWNYINRLQRAGYSFPPTNYYREQLGRDIPCSILVNKDQGVFLDPGHNQKWLSFLCDDEGEVHVYVVKGIQVAKGGVIMYGDSGRGLGVRLTDTDVFTSVTVKQAEAEVLTAQGSANHI